MGDVQKTAGFARCVDRQVEDVVGLIVIFADFVARRGEKREQDFVFGMFLADFFDQVLRRSTAEATTKGFASRGA